MIRKFFEKISLRIAEQELQGYVQKLSAGSREQNGIVLGHAYLILAQMAKKFPIVKKVVETKEDVYSKELAILVLQTNSLLKQYIADGDIKNAAGMKLWNETFRCLAHPELTNYGKEIWFYFSKAQEDAKEYLDSLEIKFCEQGNHNMIVKTREAKDCLFMVPARCKEEDSH